MMQIGIKCEFSMQHYERFVNTGYQKNFQAILREAEYRELHSLFEKTHATFFAQIMHDDYSFVIAPHTSRYRICVGKNFSKPIRDFDFIVADPEELPFESNSLDAILLTHVLEFSKHPQIILKEVYEALSSQGRLYILCFNPWSLWGLAKYFKPHRLWPWNGKFWSVLRLLKWTRQIGYVPLRTKTFLFHWPTHHRRLHDKLFFLEPLGQLLYPWMGGISLIVLQKNILSPTGFAYRWRKRMLQTAQGCPNVSSRRQA